MRNVLLLILILLFAGCAAPLKKDVASSQIAEDVRIGVLDFTVTSNTTNAGVWKRGILTVTDTELFIYLENPNDDNLEQELRLPYLEMRGIDRLKRGSAFQIQILVDVGIVALEVLKHHSIFLDPEASRNLYHYIKGKGVPKFSARGLIMFPTGQVWTFPLLEP